MSRYRLSAAAQADILHLLMHTERNFGPAARRRYQALVIAALRAIAAEADRTGSIDRPELGEGVRSYHLRHSRDSAQTRDGIVRRPRHLLLYRCSRPALIEVGRVLHDAMEVERHLPADYRDE